LQRLLHTVSPAVLVINSTAQTQCVATQFKLIVGFCATSIISINIIRQFARFTHSLQKLLYNFVKIHHFASDPLFVTVFNHLSFLLSHPYLSIVFTDVFTSPSYSPVLYLVPDLLTSTMRYSSFALGAFALLATVTYASDAAASADGDVVVITSKNVDDVLKKDSLVFVKFFAPWCGHCQAMAEDFKSAATALRGKAVLAEIDATKEEKMVSQFNVEGFPTLKLFSGGQEVADYQGNRDKESMIKFVERALLPAYETLAKAADYTKFVSENSANRIVVAVSPAGEGEAAFKKAAYGIRDVIDNIAFVAIEDAKLIKGSKKGDIYYSEFQEFTQENADMYVELGMPVVVGFYKDGSQPGVETLKTIANKKKGNGKVAFAWVDSVKLASFVEYVGLKDKDTPICAYSFETDQRFLLPEGFKMTDANLEAWVDSLIAGKIEATRKSEPIPETNDGPVYTVVGDSWDTIVEDPKTDVLIAQVASWCGHCKALKPIYNKVAEELKKAGVTGVKLALMDATENDAPGEYKAKGFPTIHFFPAGKKGVEFDGDRSSKAIIEWIQKNGVNKFEFDTSNLGADPEPPAEEPEADGGEGEMPEDEEMPEGEEGDMPEGEYDDEGSMGEEGEDMPHDDEHLPEEEEKEEL